MKDDQRTRKKNNGNNRHGSVESIKFVCMQLQRPSQRTLHSQSSIQSSHNSDRGTIKSTALQVSKISSSPNVQDETESDTDTASDMLGYCRVESNTDYALAAAASILGKHQLRDSKTRTASSSKDSDPARWSTSVDSIDGLALDSKRFSNSSASTQGNKLTTNADLDYNNEGNHTFRFMVGGLGSSGVQRAVSQHDCMEGTDLSAGEPLGNVPCLVQDEDEVAAQRLLIQNVEKQTYIVEKSIVTPPLTSEQPSDTGMSSEIQTEAQLQHVQSQSQLSEESSHGKADVSVILKDLLQYQAEANQKRVIDCTSSLASSLVSDSSTLRQSNGSVIQSIASEDQLVGQLRSNSSVGAQQVAQGNSESGVDAARGLSSLGFVQHQPFDGDTSDADLQADGGAAQQDSSNAANRTSSRYQLNSATTSSEQLCDLDQSNIESSRNMDGPSNIEQAASSSAAPTNPVPTKDPAAPNGDADTPAKSNITTTPQQSPVKAASYSSAANSPESLVAWTGPALAPIRVQVAPREGVPLGASSSNLPESSSLETATGSLEVQSSADNISITFQQGNDAQHSEQAQHRDQDSETPKMFINRDSMGHAGLQPSPQLEYGGGIKPGVGAGQESGVLEAKDRLGVFASGQKSVDEGAGRADMDAQKQGSTSGESVSIIQLKQAQGSHEQVVHVSKDQMGDQTNSSGVGGRQNSMGRGSVSLGHRATVSELPYTGTSSGELSSHLGQISIRKAVKYDINQTRSISSTDGLDTPTRRFYFKQIQEHMASLHHTLSEECASGTDDYEQTMTDIDSMESQMHSMFSKMREQMSAKFDTSSRGEGSISSNTDLKDLVLNQSTRNPLAEGPNSGDALGGQRSPSISRVYQSASGKEAQASGMNAQTAGSHVHHASQSANQAGVQSVQQENQAPTNVFAAQRTDSVSSSNCNSKVSTGSQSQTVPLAKQIDGQLVSLEYGRDVSVRCEQLIKAMVHANDWEAFVHAQGIKRLEGVLRRSAAQPQSCLSVLELLYFVMRKVVVYFEQVLIVCSPAQVYGRNKQQSSIKLTLTGNRTCKWWEVVLPQHAASLIHAVRSVTADNTRVDEVQLRGGQVIWLSVHLLSLYQCITQLNQVPIKGADRTTLNTEYQALMALVMKRVTPSNQPVVLSHADKTKIKEDAKDVYRNISGIFRALSPSLLDYLDRVLQVYSQQEKLVVAPLNTIKSLASVSHDMLKLVVKHNSLLTARIILKKYKWRDEFFDAIFRNNSHLIKQQPQSPVTAGDTPSSSNGLQPAGQLPQQEEAPLFDEQRALQELVKFGQRGHGLINGNQLDDYDSQQSPRFRQQGERKSRSQSPIGRKFKQWLGNRRDQQ